MNSCIIRNKGEIDKLIGDCIMAVYKDSDSYLKGKCADPVLNFYQNRCEYLQKRQKAGLLQDWKGIYEFLDK